MTEEKKQRLKEYLKNYHEVKNSQYIITKQFFNYGILIN